MPERVVHAKGAGAHGEFECTNGLEDLCIAGIFKKGAKCSVSCRMSTVGGESGTSDNLRDPRGFSIKFRTDEGNWDLVGNNTPIFFIRDPAKFPHFIHTQKRNPQTHKHHTDDATLYWDYLSQNPECIHQIVYMFGDRGIPYGARFMNSYFGHTVKLINDKQEWVYAQFHMLSDQGEKNQTDPDQAAKESDDLMQNDLFESIEKGDYPTWTLKVQIMTKEQAREAWKKKGINVFDLTHIWPHKDYPLREIGKMTLNKNVDNYFAEVEQISFSPAHMVPGIEPSEDPVLQSRLFSYDDTARHRIGANFMQLPVNQPTPKYKHGNFQRDGPMAYFNQGARSNYLSSIDPIQCRPRAVNLDKAHGDFVAEAISWLSILRKEDFNQPGALWRDVFNDEQKSRYVDNVVGHWSTIKDKSIISRMISIFRAVDPDLGARLEKASGVQGGPDISQITFNGSHNGMAEPVKGANSMEYAKEFGLYQSGSVTDNPPAILPEPA